MSQQVAASPTTHLCIFHNYSSSTYPCTATEGFAVFSFSFSIFLNTRLERVKDAASGSFVRSGSLSRMIATVHLVESGSIMSPREISKLMDLCGSPGNKAISIMDSDRFVLQKQWAIAPTFDSQRLEAMLKREDWLVMLQR